MTTNYSEWLQQFNQQVKAAVAVSDKIQVEASKRFLAKVEQRTPVGDPSLWKWPAPKNYKPGTLKASWSISFSKTSNGVYATVFNDQPYAERVEYGWSSQAPQGMLRITAKEWGSIVDRTAKEFKI